MPKKESLPVEPTSEVEGLPVEEVPTEAPEETPPTPEYLTREQVEEMLKEQVGQAERHFQSVADSQIATARREAQQAINYARSVEGQTISLQHEFLSGLDPDEARLRRIEMQQRQQPQYVPPPQPQYAPPPQLGPPQAITPEIADILTDYGVKVSDPKIDWGMDDPYRGKQRFLDSLERIKSEREKPLVKKDETPPPAPPPAPPVETTAARGRKPRIYTRESIASMTSEEYAESRNAILEAEEKGEINE